MALTQLRVPVASDGMGRSVPGIDLYLISDGTVVVTQAFGYIPLYEQCPGGITGVFENDGFSLTGPDDPAPQEYDFNTPYPYKQMPVFKAWLVQQNLQWPQ